MKVAEYWVRPTGTANPSVAGYYDCAHIHAIKTLLIPRYFDDIMQANA